MNFLSKSFWMFSLASLPLTLNAKPVEYSIHSMSDYSLESIATSIMEQDYPLLALHSLWCKSITIADNGSTVNNPLHMLNNKVCCNKKSYAEGFVSLCLQLGIQVRPVDKSGEYNYDFAIDGNWEFLNPLTGQYYLELDNRTLASSEAVMDDPFLALRTKPAESKKFNFIDSTLDFAKFNVITTEMGETLSQSSISFDESNFTSSEISSENFSNEVSVVKISSETQNFNFVRPFFNLSYTNDNVSYIQWQISITKDFSDNFIQLLCYDCPSKQLHFLEIDESYLENKTNYFIRVRGVYNNEEGSWSEPVMFSVVKPDPVTFIEFDKIDKNEFEISWRPVGEDIEYYVFGSNSLDFIPSIYTDTQIDEINGDNVITQPNDSLISIVKECKVTIDGSLAYYRIISKQNGIYSTPSRLIYIYDEDIIPTRNVLQQYQDDGSQAIVKRVEIPLSYSSLSSCAQLLTTTPSISAKDLLKDIHYYVLRNTTPIEGKPYPYNPHVSPDIWETVKPYFLPENHPIRPKLDRMFSAKRVMQNPDTFRQAGFKRWRPGRVSHICASGHPQLQGFFIKGFPDSDTSIKFDWKKLVGRVEGARSVKEAIYRFGFQRKFKVPRKWIYPLPEHPSPPNDPKRYLRKNFILVAEDMKILDQEKNNKKYKKSMTRKLMDAIYILLQDQGLYDSVYSFNVPYCKDGKLAFIDTEWHHRWPVAFHRFTRYFSKDNQKYWEKLIRQKGPKKIPQF